MEFSNSQVDVLKKLSFANYLNEIMQHYEIMFPLLIPLLKKECFRSFVEQGIVLAKESGYTQRGPVRLYLDMMIIFGSHFEQDPLFKKLKVEEDKNVSQIEKSVTLYTLLGKYLKTVYGLSGLYFKESIRVFQRLNIKTLPVGINVSNNELHELLRGIYPQRYDFATSDSIDELITLSDEYCRRHGLKNQNNKSYLILVMFLFGCSFGQGSFRDRFIKGLLIKYFNNKDVSNHCAIVSHYASFQINNM
ncbi:hypothetical protein [Erwinia amylovora]|uniref:Uncharacterized protein n=3 Tax=Erwinia amylovora TaxID=552 RepID=A0A831ESG2_ERWAM|nr:hypothetical protein [Erwinia amylovora]CDK16542.1 hypothetical protein LA635_2918 [Erwinia amylovora LA635]CDK19909.1 hypothetical protein LA636_2917 [Erwinia amylovora LA636]CDK23280.1 hypothetical protein LA637_2920 [Erwinia amylovora LA637]ATZ10347.1 hypothetical protein AD997_02105 [Erwinia amylovora]EKV52652.1 hypothetical protein EaACW_3241 [Erwinia amylovora ACW56400]